MMTTTIMMTMIRMTMMRMALPETVETHETCKALETKRIAKVNPSVETSPDLFVAAPPWEHVWA